MKKLLALSVALAATFATMPASAVYYLSHWDFGADPQGEFDFTGRNDLVNSGGVAMADGAAVFDGTVRSFITGHNVDLSYDKPYTIECFARAESDCDGMIMELSPNINGAYGAFYLYAKEGVMVRGGNGAYNGEQFDNGNICDGEWHHVAVIVDPAGATAADQVQLYLDGVRQANHVQNNEGSCLMAHRLYIGSRGGTSLPFKGQIDDVRITEGILSPSAFLQTRSSETLDVRGYWKFDAAAPLADSSGNGNTLQGSQGVAFTNGCASFNGTASDVRTANTFDLSAYKDVTVEFFMRKHAGTDDIRIILEHSSNGASHPGGFFLDIDETGVGRIRGLLCFATALCYGDSPTYSANTGWHHVALVKDSSNAGNDACIRLYVDGVGVSQYTRDSRSSDIYLLNDYLYLGSRSNSAYFLDADIDDVRITANVLAPGQFLRTRTGPLDDAIAYWPFEKRGLFVDATGNGNALTGSGVAVSDDGAVVLDGSQSGFSTLAPLPLYPYGSMTVEWFMKTEMSGVGMVLETSANALGNPGAFYAAANEFAGFQMTRTHSLVQGWSAADGKWHHYAIVFDWDSTTADIVRLYRDGVQVATRFSSNTNPARLRADRLFIGARNGSDYKFAGQMDDIKITGRALAPSEFMPKRSRIPTAFVLVVR